MARKIVIELGAKACTQFIEDEYREEYLDILKNPPFSNFSILAKFGNLINSTGFEELARKDGLNMSTVNEMLNCEVRLEVSIDMFELNADLVIATFNKSIFKFKISGSGGVEVVNIPKFGLSPSDAEYQAGKLIKVIIGVLRYIASPNIYVKKEETKEPTGHVKRSKKGKKAKKSYIYKTKYSIEHLHKPRKAPVDTNLDKHRDYDRLTTEWTRRGHMRRYRNPDGTIKKEVWIESVKCKAKEEPQSDAVYRITRKE